MIITVQELQILIDMNLKSEYQEHLENSRKMCEERYQEWRDNPLYFYRAKLAAEYAREYNFEIPLDVRQEIVKQAYSDYLSICEKYKIAL
jgi:hypothetical protein